MDQLLRLLHACGMPKGDADLLHGRGPAMGEVLAGAEPRSTLFTGSQRVAEKLAVDLRGKVGGPWAARARGLLRLLFGGGCAALPAELAFKPASAVSPAPKGGARRWGFRFGKAVGAAGNAASQSTHIPFSALQRCGPRVDQVNPGQTPSPSPPPGQVFLEDAGFDWKLLGPDVGDVDYVAWQCDQDAYACSGQKCSAQSMLFVHRCEGARATVRGAPAVERLLG